MIENNQELSSALISELKERISEQKPDGSFPNGHNGPYGDLETPIRNTAHMLYALCAAYELSKENYFYDSAAKALEYILNNEHITSDGYYICRISKTKDNTNGVIGHAWIIEALVKASNIFGDSPLIRAKKLWALHKFNYELGAWQKPYEGNPRKTVDHTFNHQLWFAACISSLNDKEADKQIKVFIKKNVAKLQLYENCIIYHDSQVGPLHNWVFIDPFLALRKFMKPIFRPDTKKNRYTHSVAYHAFNLYAFAMLFDNGYRNYIEEYITIGEMLSPIDKESYASELMRASDVGLGYNPSYAELEYALKILDENRYKTVRNFWINKQLLYSSCADGLLAKNSPDVATSNARLYQVFKIIEK